MISLKNVSISLGDFSLKDVDLEIPPGEYFSILGPTGAGKTVILELIAGLYSPDKGDILINNRNVEKVPPERRGVGFVYQDYALFPHLNVYKNISFGLKLRKVPADEIKDIVLELTELLNITHLLDRFPGTLSGGEQQRVSLARALALKPKILLMDEPLSALDPNTKKFLYRELKRIHQTYECTIVHVTHDFNEANVLATLVGIILDGQLRQVGTPEEVFENNSDAKVSKFLGLTASLKDKEYEEDKEYKEDKKYEEDKKRKKNFACSVLPELKNLS